MEGPKQSFNFHILVDYKLTTYGIDECLMRIGKLFVSIPMVITNVFFLTFPLSPMYDL